MVRYLDISITGQEISAIYTNEMEEYMIKFDNHLHKNFSHVPYLYEVVSRIHKISYRLLVS